MGDTVPAVIEPLLSLDLPETLTFDDWTDIGRKLCSSARAMNWLIGDWLIAGVERYGEKARTEANALFRSDVARFAPIVETCRRFPESQRHPRLTFGHHLAVVDLPSEQAERLLSEAEQGRMTTSMLKAHVRVISERQPALVDDDPDDTAYRRIVQAWNLAGRSSRQTFLESAEEAHMGVIDL